VTPVERDRTRLRQHIIDDAVSYRKVTLACNEESDFYIDMRRVTLGWYGAPLVGRVMLDLVKDLEFDAIGGLTLGADPVALAMALAGGAEGWCFDAFVVRKEPKVHGMQHRVEGPDIKGRRVLIVDDVVTSGGSAMEAVAAARDAGAEVVAVASVVRRGTAHLIVGELEHRTAFTLLNLGLEGPPPVADHQWSWKDVQVVSQGKDKDQMILVCPGPDCYYYGEVIPEHYPPLEYLKERAKEHIRKAHRGEG